MKRTYIWELNGWPYLTWDNKELSPILGEVRNRQGQLIGKISLLGDDLIQKTLHDIIISEISASARIEGKNIDLEQVIITSGQYLSKKNINLTETSDTSIGATEVAIDSLYNFKQTITEERLFLWKYLLDGKTGFDITSAGWNNNDSILNVSKLPIPERKMEYMKIPVPENIDDEMKIFLSWINTLHQTDPVIKAGVAYLRFLLIRPFESNNGRIARTIANIFLSRADNIQKRFYSISAQIERERNQYNEILKTVQTGSLDITEWLRWFLYCVENALNEAEKTLTKVMNKSKFFEKYRLLSLNERQLKMLNLLWDETDNKLTSTTWASINKCSQDTALRDIQDLIGKNILYRENAGGRSTSYSLLI